MIISLYPLQQLSMSGKRALFFLYITFISITDPLPTVTVLIVYPELMLTKITFPSLLPTKTISGDSNRGLRLQTNPQLVTIL